MSDEIESTNEDIDTKELQPKETKSVSFNSDVHVKRFGKPRESRSSSVEQQPPTRKEPFTHLSEQELINEANKVIEQAQSVSCTTDQNPEKFFSLPHRRKAKEPLDRRHSDDAEKKPLGRSTSDVSPKKRKERTSLSTLFRRAQKQTKPDAPVVVAAKPKASIVKRSKSDVSDLKSSTALNIQPRVIRKRSGSETEEFLKSLRNKKAQLSPIIESSPRDDYFKRTPPLDKVFKHKVTVEKEEPTPIETKSEVKSEVKVNPVEKPPRFKSPDKEPKPPARTKRGKSKEQSPPITETPTRTVDVKKSLLVDEIDRIRGKDINTVDIKDKIRENIRKIKENIYGNRTMSHSSQQPPEKPPLTRGHTVEPIVRILKEDSISPPRTIPTHSGTSKPFSYTKPSYSPNPNMFARTTSPDRIPSPVNKTTDKGVVYAQVVRDQNDNGNSHNGKQTVHKTYSPTKERLASLSDEDEGLGYEDRYKYSNSKYQSSNHKNREVKHKNITTHIADSPIKPKFREYKLTSFNDYEPTYANEYKIKEEQKVFLDSNFRGRADGMDNVKKSFDEPDSKLDLNFNEMSQRRQLMESRINARKFERDRVENEIPISRYLAETNPIYEANKRMKATEKYVNETAKYYRESHETDKYVESSVTEDYDRYDSGPRKIKYDPESRTFKNIDKDELDRREYLDSLGPFAGDKEFPPEPEYEPPSLEFISGKPVLGSNEYKEKKYKLRSKHVTSSHDISQSQKYKKPDPGKNKDHHTSNPEIYVNSPYEPEHKDTYHNSLRREKHQDKYYKEDFGIRRHDSGDSGDYYRHTSPRRHDFDSRLVDSGIENDFRKESNGEINRSIFRRDESDNDVRNTSLLLDSERRHTEDNYPSEQVYANGEYLARFENDRHYRKEYSSRERSTDEVSNLAPRGDRYDRSPKNGDKSDGKPPKATKKFSGLEKVKQLFSRDSSKKSRKEEERARTRVLRSPEAGSGSPEGARRSPGPGYRRYKDPTPSDDERREPRRSREDLDRHRSSDPRDSDAESRPRHAEPYRRAPRYGSSDRDSERSPRASDAERERTRSRTALDSPALAERYRDRRRLATPSPTPSPPRPAPRAAPPARASGWFKSLDRLTRKKTSKIEKESGATTEDESPRSWSKKQPKNLRFFGDTDLESDPTPSRARQPPHEDRRNRSSSLTNLSRERQFKRSLHNISEHHQEGRVKVKPPIPVDRRSRSQSSSKTLTRDLKGSQTLTRDFKGSQNLTRDLKGSQTLMRDSGSRGELDRRDLGTSRGDLGTSRGDLRSSRGDLHGSRADVRREREGSEVRGSKQEYRDQRGHRRTPRGDSSTEGDSGPQRNVVFLHATTVGDIPDPGVLARNRSRDDVSSVNSSSMQVRTTQKSFSLFAPWTPRHRNEPYDLHYAQRQRKPRPKTPSDGSTLQKNKSYSQQTLARRPQSSRLSASNASLHRKPERRREDSVAASTLTRNRNKKSQSSDILNHESDRERISRSISMPKDKNKKAGWFNLTNKNKKPEVNTRVR